MKKSPFKFQIFDSHNTCTESEMPLAQSVRTAQAIARRLSLTKHHVIVSNDKGWEEYESAKKVSWSVPDGMSSEDRPEPGKQYSLTGGKGQKCIANGDSWAESEVKAGAIINENTN